MRSFGSLTWINPPSVWLAKAATDPVGHYVFDSLCGCRRDSPTGDGWRIVLQFTALVRARQRYEFGRGGARPVCVLEKPPVSRSVSIQHVTDR
jgi:hypothetical protein